MSQKDTRFDEFASLFRSVVKPHLEVEPLQLKRLLVVLDSRGNVEKRDGTCRLARAMTERFKTETRVLCPVSDEDEKKAAQKQCDELVETITSKGGDAKGRVEVGFAASQVLAEIDSFEADFVVIPSLFGEQDEDLEEYSLGAVVDKVLSMTGKPILLVEGPVLEPDELWSDILLFVEETDTAEPCLAATRTLAAKEADARLLHVIDSHMLKLVEKAFAVATELDTTVACAALEKALYKDMEHFLAGAKELLDRTGHRSEFMIEVGDPVEVCREIIKEKGPNLVICNSVSPHQRLVDSVAYNLAAYLRETPLLLV